MPSLLLHAASDGATLAVVSRVDAFAGASGWAIVGPLLLHRMSEGLFLSTLFVPSHGYVGTFVRLGLVGTATVIGALLGASMLARVPEFIFDGTLALGLGVIAHMMMHPASSRVGAARPGAQKHWVSGLGFLGGACVAVFLTGPVSILTTARPRELSALQSLGPMFVAMAPAAVLGLAVASGLRMLQSSGASTKLAALLRAHDRGRGFWSALLLLPTAAGVDGWFVSLRFLGLPLTLMRVLLGAGVALMMRPSGSPMLEQAPATSQTVRPAAPPSKASWGLALVEPAAAGGPWLLLGLVLASALEAAVGQDVLAHTPPWLGRLLLALAVVVLHLCAPGSSAVGAVLIHKGLAAGATVGALTAALGVHAGSMASHRRPAARIGLAVVVCAAFGLAADHLFPTGLAPDFHALASPDHPLVEWLASGLLSVWLTAGLLWLGPRAWLSRLWHRTP